MSAMTASPTALPTIVSPYRVTFAHLLRSEFIKFRTVRSTWWTAAITVLLMVLLAVPMSMGLSGQGAQTGGSAAAAIVTGFFFAQLSVAVLGALTITGEYGTGMIRSTLSAAPTRLPALWAKTLVTMVATAAIAIVGLALSTVIALLILGSDQSFDFTSAETWGPVGLCVVYLMLISVMAVSIGTLIRHSAGAIATLVGILFVLNMVLSSIPLDWMREAAQYTPSGLGQALMLPGQFAASTPSQPVAFLVLALWAAIPMVGASLALISRDA